MIKYRGFFFAKIKGFKDINATVKWFVPHCVPAQLDVPSIKFIDNKFDKMNYCCSCQVYKEPTCDVFH